MRSAHPMAIGTSRSAVPSAFLFDGSTIAVELQLMMMMVNSWVNCTTNPPTPCLRMNKISRKPAHTVAGLACARQHQENPAGHHGARGGG